MNSIRTWLHQPAWGRWMITAVAAVGIAGAQPAAASSQGDHLAGAIIGAGIGAVIGHHVGGSDGAFVGGVIGAAVGSNAGRHGGGHNGNRYRRNHGQRHGHHNRYVPRNNVVVQYHSGRRYTTSRPVHDYYGNVSYGSSWSSARRIHRGQRQQHRVERAYRRGYHQGFRDGSHHRHPNRRQAQRRP